MISDFFNAPLLKEAIEPSNAVLTVPDPPEEGTEIDGGTGGGGMAELGKAAGAIAMGGGGGGGGGEASEELNTLVFGIRSFVAVVGMETLSSNPLFC
jgi:hypothetical protein